MSTWRRKALELVPEQKAAIEQAENPMQLWIELHLRFEDAVRSQAMGLVQRLLNLAHWSLQQRGPDAPSDVSTAAALCFYEHLHGVDQAALLAGSITADEFADLEDVFRYHMNAADFEIFRSAFVRRRRELDMEAKRQTGRAGPARKDRRRGC